MQATADSSSVSHRDGSPLDTIPVPIPAAGEAFVYRGRDGRVVLVDTAEARSVVTQSDPYEALEYARQVLRAVRTLASQTTDDDLHSAIDAVIQSA